MIEDITPLHDWAEIVGLPYHAAYRLARKGAIRAVQPGGPGTRWLVVDGGIREEAVDRRRDDDVMAALERHRDNDA